jgi:predicted ATP-grasp superfamily ATP-dependent carboligase
MMGKNKYVRTHECAHNSNNPVKKELVLYVKSNELPVDKELSLVSTRLDKAGEYTWEHKIKVVSTLLATGNMAHAAREHKVDYSTLQDWKKKPWWPKLLAEVKQAARGELQTKMSKIVGKALDAVEDRIENGEVILNNKTGELLRKPASLRDVSTVANNMLHQQIQIEKLEKGATIQQETMQDLLKQLHGEFAKFNSKTKQNNATDIPFVENT